jgi:multidrug efflux system membrane fusion protein
MVHKILNSVLVGDKGMKISWRILGLLLLTLFSSACSNGKAKNSIAPPPVIVGLATKKTVPVELRAIGNVQAYSTVMVKSKVG